MSDSELALITKKGIKILTIQSSFPCIGLNNFQRIGTVLAVYINLYRNKPIWADAAGGGTFALSQEEIAKTVQFFGYNLVQCLIKNSESSKLFVPCFTYQCQFKHGVLREL